MTKNRSMSFNALIRRINQLDGDIARIALESSSDAEILFKTISENLICDNEKLQDKTIRFVRSMLHRLSSGGIRHFIRRIESRSFTAIEVLKKNGLIHSQEEPKKHWFFTKENIEALSKFNQKLFKEMRLHESELCRAYERYEETEKKEPIFYVNGFKIELADLPLILKKLAKKPRVPFNVKKLTEENAPEMKAQIKNVVSFLKSLPGARIPNSQKSIKKWLKEKN